MPFVFRVKGEPCKTTQATRARTTRTTTLSDTPKSFVDEPASQRGFRAAPVRRGVLTGQHPPGREGRRTEAMEFKSGVQPSDVKAARSGDDLWLYIKGTSDRGRVCSM